MRPEPFPAEVHRRRRTRVLERLGGDAMVLPAAPLLVRGRDAELPYRPDPELFYLTGFTEPGAVAVLRGFADEDRFLLFVRDRDEDAERWSGIRSGPEAARGAVEADRAHPLDELETRLPGLLEGAGRVHFRLEVQPTGVRRRCQELVTETLARARRKGVRHGTGPRGVEEPGELLDELRLRKEPGELERIRRAVAVTVEAFREGLARVAPGRGEWEVEAALEAGFRSRGADGPAFPTIVGSGPNGCVLHYVANRRRMGSGELVLVDGGAEAGLYAGDVTRTVPVDGGFTEAQRDLYQVVERARREAVARVAPGVGIEEIHRTAVGELTDGLLALGILEGDAEEAVEGKAYRRYFPHNTSHWLGMDVHDPGDYAREGVARILEPGMVLTVEPGLYVPEGGGEPSAFAGTGIRIEDDVLVTEEGGDVLTEELPTALDDVGSLVGGGRDGR